MISVGRRSRLDFHLCLLVDAGLLALLRQSQGESQKRLEARAIECRISPILPPLGGRRLTCTSAACKTVESGNAVCSSGCEILEVLRLGVLSLGVVGLGNLGGIGWDFRFD